MMHRLLGAAVLALMVTVAGRAQDSSSLMSLDTFPTTSLQIRSGDKTHDFEIWLAQTPQQQEQGLMFVRDLPANRGMLFLAEKPRVFNMWMKNTYIPLDMVFIGADNRISSIAANTVPHSTKIVSSGTPVAGILEIKGGAAKQLALHPGDRVSWTTPKPTALNADAPVAP
jgi:uncharacterized membrane protein (UPF0127 family)